MVKIRAFTYESGKIPVGYKCEKCKAAGCKLWRQYQTLADQIELLCANCAEKDQDRKLELEDGGSDQIGDLVPAIPTEDGGTYWGYTSVPDAGCEWFDVLPIRPGQKPPQDSLTPYMRRRFQLLHRNKRFYKEVLGEFATHARRQLEHGKPVDENQLERIEGFAK